jgi:hypothetical protein
MGNQCAGTRHDGEPCGFAVIKAGDYCRNHADQAGPQNLGNPEPVADDPAFAVVGDPAPLNVLTEPVSPEILPDTAAHEGMSVEARQAEKRATAMARRKSVRDARKSLGGHSGQKMVARNREGYHRHWINDDGTNLEEMRDKGYDFVHDENASIESDDEGSRKSLQVSKSGRPMRAYLMEIPQEAYLEDQAEKELSIQGTENSIRSASSGGGIGGEKDNAGQSVVYDPQEEGENQLLG